MSQANPKAQRSITNPIIGDTLTFIELTAESDGKRTVIEVELEPKGSSEPHFHTLICETFEPITGTLGLRSGKRELFLNNGEAKTIETGIAHQYFNPTSDKIRFRVTIEPGFRGFEQFLQIIYGLAKDGQTTNSGMPKNLLHIGVLLAMSDTNLPGFVRIIEPVVKIAGAIGRRIGIDKELVKTYCKI